MTDFVLNFVSGNVREDYMEIFPSIFFMVFGFCLKMNFVFRKSVHHPDFRGYLASASVYLFLISLFLICPSAVFAIEDENTGEPAGFFMEYIDEEPASTPVEMITCGNTECDPETELCCESGDGKQGSCYSKTGTRKCCSGEETAEIYDPGSENCCSDSVIVSKDTGCACSKDNPVCPDNGECCAPENGENGTCITEYYKNYGYKCCRGKDSATQYDPEIDKCCLDGSIIPQYESCTCSEKNPECSGDQECCIPETGEHGKCIDKSIEQCCSGGKVLSKDVGCACSKDNPVCPDNGECCAPENGETGTCITEDEKKREYKCCRGNELATIYDSLHGRRDIHMHDPSGVVAPLSKCCSDGSVAYGYRYGMSDLIEYPACPCDQDNPDCTDGEKCCLSKDGENGSCFNENLFSCCSGKSKVSLYNPEEEKCCKDGNSYLINPNEGAKFSCKCLDSNGPPKCCGSYIPEKGYYCCHGEIEKKDITVCCPDWGHLAVGGDGARDLIEVTLEKFNPDEHPNIVVMGERFPRVCKHNFTPLFRSYCTPIGCYLAITIPGELEPEIPPFFLLDFD